MQLLRMRSCFPDCFTAAAKVSRPHWLTLCCAVLCCAVLCCTVLCCAVLCRAALLQLTVPEVEYKAVTSLGKSALTRLYHRHSQPHIKKKKKNDV